ncbi:MAG: hypothetical protein LBB61_01710 [Treponema sp.]|jgi:hypothetical protein|nr:hypothetical protein [Treponema sp.]
MKRSELRGTAGVSCGMKALCLRYRLQRFARLALLSLLALRPAVSLQAKASAETTPALLNPQWDFAVAAFDVSALPPEHQTVGERVQREFVLMLNAVKKRKRIDAEYAYYESVAWEKSRAAAAKAIAAKWKQRDQLLFNGDPLWKYKKSLKTIDAELETLQEAFEKASAEAPAITQEPAFTLIEDNKKGVYPNPPDTGKEYAFCDQQHIDGFLTGSITLYHGYLYLKLKVYTLYSTSYSYEDSILFSSDQTSDAIRELTRDLMEAVSGRTPAALTVHTEPQDASIFIDETFAGTGEVSDIEHSSGEVTVTASANKRETASISVELNEDEQTDISFTLPLITLAPLSFTALVPQAKPKWALFTPTSFFEQSAAVYQGALYMGQAPLTLDTSSGMFTYYRIESDQTGPDGTVKKTAGTFVIDARERMVTVKTRVLPDEKRPVEKAMDRMYLSYGLFWLALPVALVAGMDVLWGGRGGMLGAAIQGRSQEDANTWFPISIGASIAAGAALASTIFNVVLSFSTASMNSPALLK